MCFWFKKPKCPATPKRNYGNLPNNARLPNARKRYGWIPDRPDVRDMPFKAATTAPSVALPQTVDLRIKCSPVEVQGNLGSCTSNALAGNIEFLEKPIDGIFVNVSRLFIYYNERLIEGTECFDAGAFIRDGIKTLVSQGYCFENTWSYIEKNYNVEPPHNAYEEASNHKITSYRRMYSVQDMLSCLSEGYPFVFGFSVYESFESDEVTKTGIVPMPDYTETLVGGHAVVAVGYDMVSQRFICRNSWGEGWGDKGYFTLPFLYMSSLASDFWTIRK
jgi:C1A family cysteine protease